MRSEHLVYIRKLFVDQKPDSHGRLSWEVVWRDDNTKRWRAQMFFTTEKALKFWPGRKVVEDAATIEKLFKAQGGKEQAAILERRARAQAMEGTSYRPEYIEAVREGKI